MLIFSTYAIVFLNCFSETEMIKKKKKSAVNIPIDILCNYLTLRS